MRTKTVVLGLTIVLVTLAIMLVACGSSSSQPTTQPNTAPTVASPAADGATLLESRCTVCHNLDRVKAAKKTLDGWKQTVTRMVGKGAQLSADEQSVLVDYLAKTYGP